MRERERENVQIPVVVFGDHRLPLSLQCYEQLSGTSEFAGWDQLTRYVALSCRSFPLIGCYTTEKVII